MTAEADPLVLHLAELPVRFEWSNLAGLGAWSAAVEVPAAAVPELGINRMINGEVGEARLEIAAGSGLAQALGWEWRGPGEATAVLLRFQGAGPFRFGPPPERGGIVIPEGNGPEDALGRIGGSR